MHARTDARSSASSVTPTPGRRPAHERRGSPRLARILTTTALDEGQHRLERSVELLHGVLVRDTELLEDERGTAAHVDVVVLQRSEHRVRDPWPGGGERLPGGVANPPRPVAERGHEEHCAARSRGGTGSPDRMCADERVRILETLERAAERLARGRLPERLERCRTDLRGCVPGRVGDVTERQGGVPGKEPDRGEPDGGARMAQQREQSGPGARRELVEGRSHAHGRVAPVRKCFDQAVDRPFVTVPEPPERGHARRSHLRLGAPEAVHEHLTVVCRSARRLGSHGRGLEEGPVAHLAALLAATPTESPAEDDEDHDRPADADQRGAEHHRPPTIHRLFVGAGRERDPTRSGGRNPTPEGSRSTPLGRSGPPCAPSWRRSRRPGRFAPPVRSASEGREEQHGLDLPALQDDRVDVRAHPLVAGCRDRHDDPVGARLRRESGECDLLRRDDRDF